MLGMNAPFDSRIPKLELYIPFDPHYPIVKYPNCAKGNRLSKQETPLWYKHSVIHARGVKGGNCIVQRHFCLSHYRTKAGYLLARFDRKYPMLNEDLTRGNKILIPLQPDHYQRVLYARRVFPQGTIAITDLEFTAPLTVPSCYLY